MRRHHLRKFRAVAESIILFLIDALALLAIFEVSVLVRARVLPLVYQGFPTNHPFKNTSNIWWILLIWLFFLWYKDLYTRRFSLWEEIEAIAKACFFATAGVFTIISMNKLSEEISRTLIVEMGCLSMILLPAVRVLTKKILRKAGLFKRKVLIIGAIESGVVIARALRNDTNYGYEVSAFIDDDPEMVGSRVDGIKVHGGLDRAVACIERSGINDVFISIPNQDGERLRELIGKLQHKVERLLVVPDMFGIVVLETTLKHFFHEQVFAFEIQNNLSKRVNLLVKRLFDILVSVILTILLAIPMLIIALIIRLGSRGPSLFFQERVGRGGRTFQCYKFRTMRDDAEERLERLLRSDEAAALEWEVYRKLRSDPRTTGIGRFLRRASLDELPQLFNVLKGEMSIVGPRPVVQGEIDKYYKEMAELCFSVPPGITGLWQVSGRTDTSYDSRIGFDSWYVKNWNLWIDIMIVLKTVRAVWRGHGAY